MSKLLDEQKILLITPTNYKEMEIELNKMTKEGWQPWGTLTDSGILIMYRYTVPQRFPIAVPQKVKDEVTRNSDLPF